MSDLELNPYAQYLKVHELKARIKELEAVAEASECYIKAQIDPNDTEYFALERLQNALRAAGYLK